MNISVWHSALPFALKYLCTIKLVQEFFVNKKFNFI
ncbi:unknown [[Mannheimia] succiniciproducens MBEL55E]|uniref:Uncharacterized protein n=1 Tax=Mannheimia succiniciproducens (strain KCTC 0769BP / MBEL55E) TaxID=221988 RepID=Q65TF5_MANSM|nr:unknown [[Mannheimia] succiniciproducens MBEL55E]